MRKQLIVFGFLLAGFISLASCVKRDGMGMPEGALSEVAFGFVRELPGEVATKSVIDAADFESKFTSITYAAYSGGTLYRSTFFEDANGGLNTAGTSITLEKGFTYMVYAFVNMGDVRTSLPSSETGIASVVYSVPAYKNGSVSDVNSRGIPMSGSISFKPASSSESKTITLKRLLAKVTATLSCDWDGARIVSSKVYNMNGVLKPFGSSAAGGPADILLFQDIQDGVGAKSLTATFYVPENMQGVFSGITASDDKKAENSLISSLTGRLTYMETVVESTGKYAGRITYRTYLGANATSNFNIERNKHYRWTINYHSDKVDDYDDDWKHDIDDVDGLTIYDYAMSLSPNPAGVSVGGNLTFVTTLQTKTVKPQASSSESVLSNGSCLWSSDDETVATVSNGVVTGHKAGTAHITARWTPPGYDNTEISATATVNVSNVTTNYLEVYATPSVQNVGSTIQLGAKYHTVVNGVDDGGVVVSASWTGLDIGTDYSRINVNGSTGVVTNTTGAATRTIRGTYNDKSAEVTVSFTDVITYRLAFTNPSGTSATTRSKITVGGSHPLQVTLYKSTNGVEDSGTVLQNSSVTWSIVSGSSYATVTSAGVLTGTAVGDVNVQASYTPSGYSAVTATAYVSIISDSSGGIDWGWDEEEEIII